MKPVKNITGFDIKIQKRADLPGFVTIYIGKGSIIGENSVGAHSLGVRMEKAKRRLRVYLARQGVAPIFEPGTDNDLDSKRGAYADGLIVVGYADIPGTGPDWAYWANLSTVSLQQAILLSLGIEPPKVGSTAIVQTSEFRTRHAIALSHLGGALLAFHPPGADSLLEADHVRLGQFREWGEALAAPFGFPDEFPNTGAKLQKEVMSYSTDWKHWARQDLWSEAELAEICTGRIPGTPSRSDNEQIAINSAAEKIRRGILARALPFIPRDDADSAARMYGTARHFVPAIAADWAAKQFDTFPASLLAAVREKAQDVPRSSAIVTSEPAREKPLVARERNNLLRIVRALDAMNPRPLPTTGYAESIRAKLDELGLSPVSDDTIRKVIEDARKLDS